MSPSELERREVSAHSWHYRIKPLKWERLSERHWKAAHSLEICDIEYFSFDAHFTCYLSSGIERHPTLDAAKAACEAHHRRQAERLLERVEVDPELIRLQSLSQQLAERLYEFHGHSQEGSILLDEDALKLIEAARAANAGGSDA